MTYSKSDAEHWARVLNAMDYTPTAEDELRTDATSDGIELALQQAERYNGMELPSGVVRHALGGATVVREAVDMVMGEMRRESFHDVREHRPKLPGVYLPSFDRNDPVCMRGLFAVFAGNPSVVHSLRYDRVEDLVARPPLHNTCYWRGQNVMCADYAREVWCFSRGQYVVVFPTCFECNFWLLAGAPDPNTYAQMCQARHHASSQTRGVQSEAFRPE